MWPYYKILPDLPRPPQHFFDAVTVDPDNLPDQTDVHEIRIRNCQRQGQQFLASRSVRTPINDEWESWVRKHIVSKFNETGINWRHCNSDSSGIHTDTTRDYTLSYNITTGGPDCQVVWWQQQGQPLMRGHAIQHLNFDDVEPVATLPGNIDSWFIHETRILHSAEGISEPRVQFQISLNQADIPTEWLV